MSLKQSLKNWKALSWKSSSFSPPQQLLLLQCMSPTGPGPRPARPVPQKTAEEDELVALQAEMAL